MPFPDSEYPSILRGRDKREGQRLLDAAPDMLAALRHSYLAITYMMHNDDCGGAANALEFVTAAIAKAEGRDE
jgi:hypothetical protein